MNTTVLVRLANLVAARLFGVVGIAFAFTALVVYLCGKTSFGVPYLMPLSPLSLAGLNDTLLLRPKKALGNAARELEDSDA